MKFLYEAKTVWKVLWLFCANHFQPALSGVSPIWKSCRMQQWAELHHLRARAHYASWESEIILGSICLSNGSLVPLRKWKKSPKSLHLPMPAVRLVYFKLWLLAMYWANAIIYFILVGALQFFVSLRSNGEPSHEFCLKTGVLSCKCLC